MSEDKTRILHFLSSILTSIIAFIRKKRYIKG